MVMYCLNTCAVRLIISFFVLKMAGRKISAIYNVAVGRVPGWHACRGGGASMVLMTAESSCRAEVG